jgi:hypothetical protein
MGVAVMGAYTAPPAPFGPGRSARTVTVSVPGVGPSTVPGARGRGRTGLSGTATGSHWRVFAHFVTSGYRFLCPMVPCCLMSSRTSGSASASCAEVRCHDRAVVAGARDRRRGCRLLAPERIVLRNLRWPARSPVRGRAARPDGCRRGSRGSAGRLRTTNSPEGRLAAAVRPPRCSFVRESAPPPAGSIQLVSGECSACSDSGLTLGGSSPDDNRALDGPGRGRQPRVLERSRRRPTRSVRPSRSTAPFTIVGITAPGSSARPSRCAAPMPGCR